MGTYRFVLEYDGTEFEGWQRQAAGHRTVQGAFEVALARACGAFVPVVGAGRTDAGVHAEGQVASGTFDTGLAPEDLGRALNALLPHDLAVVEVSRPREGFHARRDAQWKVYRYRVWNASRRSPLRERWSHGCRARLDLDAMRACAPHLVGTHDFASFQASGSSPRTSVRHLRRVEIHGRSGGEITFEVEGDGFLRHMVRNLVGTLLEVGQGRRAPDSLPDVLGARDRSAAGPTLPARGLCLVRVAYGDSCAIPVR